jgi:hypothetical protein
MRHTHLHTEHKHGVLWVGSDGVLHDDGSPFAFNTANSGSKLSGIHRTAGHQLLAYIKERLGNASHLGMTDCEDSSHLQQHTGSVLYHWTTVSSLENWTNPSHTGPGETYLTKDGNAHDLNPDIPDGNIRIAVDADQLDPDQFDDTNQWPHNHLYKGPIPQKAVLEIKHVERPSYEYPQVLPVADLNPKALGDDEKRHNEVQFSADTGWLA